MKQRSARADTTSQFRARRALPSGSLRQSSFILAERDDCRFLSPKQELAALQRFNQLQRFKQRVAEGVCQSHAAHECGLGRTSAWRWLKRYRTGGLLALAPQTHRRGRRSIAERVGLTPILITQLQRLCLAVGSTAKAFRIFARMPQCPPPLARVILHAKSIPPSLSRLISFQPVKFTGVQAGDQILIQKRGTR